MTNKNNTAVYTGVTNDLVRRVYEHKQKLVKGFTSKYNITKLVYFEAADNPMSAIAREKAIKNLVRRKKNEIITAINPTWNDLYLEILSG